MRSHAAALALLSAFLALPITVTAQDAGLVLDDLLVPNVEKQVRDLPKLQPQEERGRGPAMRFDVGTVVNVMTEGEAKLEPTGSLGVGWTVYEPPCPKQKLVQIPALGQEPPQWVCAQQKRHIVKAHVQVELTALPGDVDGLSTLDPASFRAVGAEFAGSWRPFRSIAAAAYAGVGFDSRLKTRDQTPADEAPKHASFGVLFETDNRDSWLSVGLGPTQQLDGRYVLAIQTSGGITLAQVPDGRSLAGTALALRVTAILGLEHSPNVSGRRDIVTAAISAAWGRR